MTTSESPLADSQHAPEARPVIYEVQAQERNGRYGYVITIGNAGNRWTSPWVEAEGAATLGEALLAGQAEAVRLSVALRGGSGPA